MKYIIMCGGDYKQWETPRQLLKVNDEILIERTIRLLRENGIKDIAISTNNPAFDYLNVELLRDKKNKYVCFGENELKKSECSWLNAYYPIEEEVCYLHGDVYFSDDAIKTIINTKVKDTMFFAVPDKQDVPNKDRRNSKGREPIAYKVVNYKLFRNAINDLLKMIDEGKFENAKVKPIAWTVYRYLNGLDIGTNAQNYGDLNSIFNSKGDYTIINDYTTDIDKKDDIIKIEKSLKGGNMVRVEVINEFTLGDFYKIKNTIVRKARSKEGYLFVGDTFECDEDMLKYLTGANSYKRTFIKVIEVIPEATVENVVEKVELHKEAKPSMKITKKPSKKSKKK